MNVQELERCFHRAFQGSYSKKKLFLVFATLFCCGILVVFCRTLAIHASDWVAMSLTFLPILLSSGVLFSLGIILIRIYYHEVKQHTFHIHSIFTSSRHLILDTFYLSAPSILIYILLWILLGIFLVIKEIPGIGVLLSFAPFLLILGSLLLCLGNFVLLFFITPAIALKGGERLQIQTILEKIKDRSFSHILFFLIALFPIGCVVGLLTLAAVLTGGYLLSDHPLSIAIRWFFIMFPFAALLAPAVIFFFNLATEAYNLLYKR